MKYQVKPEFVNQVDGNYKVWRAGGYVLAIASKEDAELIVRALNREGLFDGLANQLKIAMKSTFGPALWRQDVRDILARIKAAEKGGG